MATLVCQTCHTAYPDSEPLWRCPCGGLLDLEFWWELAALGSVMLLGHWQEMRALGQARGALAALAELMPDEAERVAADRTELVPIAMLEVGDVVLVRPGARVPADVAVCPDCIADVADRTNRRSGYALTSCASCSFRSFARSPCWHSATTAPLPATTS